MRLLIAIPVFNERKYLSRVLDKVRTFHPEILVVDDGSSDGTSKVLQHRNDIQVLRHPVNMGYGQSLIDAFNFAEKRGYEWVITMDCDEQHEPERIPDFIQQIQTNQYDLISGSRYLQPTNGDDLPPGDRRTINASITEILNELFGFGLTDSFCGFKAHRVCATQRLALTERGYAFPMQLWPRVAFGGLRVKEIPVRLIYNDPKRHFGGLLDDAQYRMKHYLDVLQYELEHPVQLSEPAAECSGCGCE